MENAGGAPSSPAFGMLLRHHRLAAGLSQEALAERARISTNGVSALERGYRRTPQRETLALLASALALTPEELREFEAAAAHSAHAAHEETPALPTALTSFIGRETQVAEIVALARRHRLVTVTGSGGVGKTQTALRVATLAAGDYNGSACFVGLASVGDPRLVTAAIASALNVQEIPGRPLLETLLAYVRNKPLLLILDNCEHLVAEAASVAETLLAGSTQLRVLATSRESLRTAGERTYRLPSMNEDEAVALFADRARAVDHHFAVTEQNEEIVAALCRRLDGIPLAIELAAARVNLLSLQALAKKLDDSLRLLTGGERMALPRQQTMRATIEWSYALLEPQERRVFERLSLFAGGCTVEIAAAVCGDEGEAEVDVFCALSSLVDKSLIVANLVEGQPRYALLESFREYAREKLSARDDAGGVAHRYARVYLDLAEWLERNYEFESDGAWRTVARHELDNWRVALQWSLTGDGDASLGQNLVGALRVVWQYFAPLEGARWLAAALRRVDGATPASVLARLSFAEAIIAWSVRDHNAHLSSSERAIACYRAAGDRLGAARAQNQAGHALIALGRSEEGRPLLREALAVARELGSCRLIAYIVRCLGWDSSANLHDVVAARGYMAEALEIYEAIGAELNVAFTLNDLGECEFSAGNLDLALAYANRAVSMLRKFNDAPLVAHALDSLTLYLISLGRYDEARERALEVLEMARDHHLDVVVAQALQHLAAIAAFRPAASARRQEETSRSVARLLGFVDARFAATGSTRLHNQQQQEYDRSVAAVHAAIGEPAVALAMTEGATMSEEQAVAVALEKIAPRKEQM